MSRTETDSLGTIEVPDDAYWGAQTQRSLENFAIGGQRMPLAVIHALALIKKAAARVNDHLGELPPEVARLIEQAADEVLAGRHDEHFPLVVWQTGSGTQTNMNVNEVIAGRANELAGNPRGGKSPVHPNDHVNRAQSSNDSFPTAMHIAAAKAVHEQLLPAIAELSGGLAEQSARHASLVKTGRTHLMDATPITFGQELSAFVAQLDYAERAIRAALPAVYQLAQGGTAVGTGLNAPKGFADAIAAVGKPDIAINTVGKVLKKPFTEISEAEYDEMSAVNAKSAFFFLREAGKHINDNGKICTLVTSLLGAYTPYYAAYAGTKAPVEHFTRAASKEFGARGISVTAVGPGPMDTPFFYPAEGADAVAYHKTAAALSPFSRTGLTDIEDVVPFIRHLVSEGWWITGQTILINGGYTTK